MWGSVANANSGKLCYKLECILIYATHILAKLWITAMLTQSGMRPKTLHFAYKYTWRIPAAVWGLCGENCPKSAKVWKISQNVESSDSMISIT